MSRPIEATGTATGEGEASLREAESPTRPEGAFDWGVIGVSTAIVVLTFYLAARYLIAPGEQRSDHIKREVLEES